MRARSRKVNMSDYRRRDFEKVYICTAARPWTVVVTHLFSGVRTEHTLVRLHDGGSSRQGKWSSSMRYANSVIGQLDLWCARGRGWCGGDSEARCAHAHKGEGSRPHCVRRGLYGSGILERTARHHTSSLFVRFRMIKCPHAPRTN